MKRRLIRLAALLLTAACVRTNATLHNPSPIARPKVAPSAVRIYRTADQVGRPFEEIALLNSTGESNLTDENDLFESMRKKAGELGANGVILDAVNEASAGAKVAAAIFGTGTQRKGRAIAIYVLPDSSKR